MRMALGAQRGKTISMAVRQGMRLAVTGIVIGSAMAMGLTRPMVSLVYDVEARDLTTFVTVALTLAATALLACWVPAAKAALVEPLAA